MNKQTNLINQLIIDAPIGNINSIEFIGSGYASLAYKISSSIGELVVLTPKSDCIETPDYIYYFSILKTLEEIDYKYAPKPIYVNLNQSAIIMTCVPGSSISWVDDSSEKLQKQVIEKLIDALLDLRRASFKRCSEIYKQLCGRELQTDTLQKSSDHYITEWFKLAKLGIPNQTLIEWIQPKVLSCEEYVRNSKPGSKIVLTHGDSSSCNILLTSDLKLNLIDWDTSSFYQYPDGWDDFGMGYLFNHLELFQKHRSFVFSLISKKCQISINELEEIITKSQEFIKLGDIMWAIMMNSRATAGEIGGNPVEFLQIAKQRISEYDSLFASRSFLKIV